MIRYILAILLLLPQYTYALGEIKNNKISGKITDFDNGTALPGVSIFIPELQKGTVSDSNGNYALENLPNGKIKVQFSFVGYESSINTISITKENTELNISMPFTSVTTQDIVVSGGFPSAQHENAIKISVLAKEDLKRLSTPSLGEKLATIPGVDVISRSPGVSTPVIRGLSLNNILFLNNGVRLENFQFSTDHPFLINEEGADHIEVIKGPASLLYGSDAMGGVINIVREKPAPANSLKADISSEYHSVTQGLATTVGVKASQKNWFWMLRANKQSHKDYKDGNGEYVPNTRFNSKGLQLGMGMVKDFGSFKIYYDYLQPKLGMTNEESINLVNAGNRKNNRWYQNLTQHLISSRNKLFLGNYKLELNAAYQFNQRRLNGNPESTVFRLVDMDLNTFTYDSKLYFPSSETTEFLIGIQGMHQSNTNHEAPNHIIPNAQIDDFSTFALLKKEINTVGIQLGLRYDHRSLYVPEQKAGGHSHAEPGVHDDHEEETVHINRQFDNLNASVGATFHLSEKLLMRTNFATGYRVPNLAELTQHGLHGNRFEEGNADLDPQKSLESDLGIHYHTRNYNIDFSVFYNKIYDYMYLAPTDEVAPEGSGFVYAYQQQDAKLYGGELAVNLAPTSFLKLHSDYAMVIAKQNDGGHLPFIPQHKLNTSARLFAKGNQTFKSPFIGLSWKHAFEQNHPSQFESETSAYDLIAIQAGSDFQLAKYQTSLVLSVNNLFNETYIDHLSSLKPLNFYNPGRDISLKFSLKF
ncbi:TonB-dependent receptor [Labilibaculum sp. K2S]|uniref:TonB-dependent receptor n=1 Tax=Labilibaculum sp. K2S TaxID=3056386 RepID=UPI0025A468B1|nr:TonB-dependent receptor [Labilibaculum sp. K2S]MDM8158954.1 TonB-dependent receptor [Labilibaculum sp. K2S]